MTNVYDILAERGFLKQCSHPEELRELLGREKVAFYIGYDPTADSLHIGHYVALMTMAHMQRAGHLPIVLLGGGTACIGDPSGKSDMRRMMTTEEIDHNAACFQKQMARLIDFSDGKAIIANNADWLRSLNFLDFMRDIGTQYSVNRMLTFECYKQRMEKGLTFFEMGYMLLQGYDFLELNRKYGCVLQMGGDDQWSNMLGGADLIRRKERESAFACTFQLLLTHDGRKMGKTEKGALWLDPAKTSPYDFYQYWRNVDDQDVEKCLGLLTFLPMDEVRRLGALKDSQINEAKKVLAYEVTKLVHGEEEAEKAQEAAASLFGGAAMGGSIPTTEITAADLEKDARVTTLLVTCGLAASNSAARRLVQGGGVSLGEEKVTDVNAVVTAEMIPTDGLMLRSGKKKFHRVVLK